MSPRVRRGRSFSSGGRTSGSSRSTSLTTPSTTSDPGERRSVTTWPREQPRRPNRRWPFGPGSFEDRALASDRVDDSEDLYRRVRFGANHYTVDQGRARLTSQAFADRAARPSVDRALLRGNNPTRTQGDERNAVVRLETHAV